MKSSISKTSRTYPDTNFHWFLRFLSDQLPLGLAVELSLGIYLFFKSTFSNYSKKSQNYTDSSIVH